ncbi:MAG TPA: undecaprenyl-phosphate galactose phosphotransferase WbaP [Bryobacteraceae bacterium]|jgi:Undecaprenyl-phosphate galactose phosphotransferase WbaP|nr:undecaprenyl-phosphate galactose phosphotransferase WbaP [Bryobacteraceae bacterium]
MTSATTEPRPAPSPKGELSVQFRGAHSSVLTGIALAVSDLLALSLALAAGYFIWLFVNPTIPRINTILLLVPLGTIAEFLYSGHYPGLGLTAVEHLRRICRGITLVYLLMAAAILLAKDMSAASRGAVLLAWLLSLIAVPLARSLTTHLLASRSRWGVPVIIIGAGDTGRAVIRNLRLNRILGYQPVACLDDDPNKLGDCEGVPVLGGLLDAAMAAELAGARHAIVAIPRINGEQLAWHLRRWRQIFPRLLIVPDLAGIASLWTEPHDLGGLLGVEIRHNLLDPWNQNIKRALDIVTAAIGIVLAAPLVAFCAARIKLASPGSAFYSQEREAQNGLKIRVLKLRTMYPDAEETLRTHLAGDAAARAEWDRFCKLKHDPRILPGVGHLLRQTSLDELPQLWNILKGEMSLVGPRPFPAYHNARFDPEFRSVRMQVKPGLTGLWQISARSDGDIAVQESLDSYYIRNWSIWLDLYILVRTVRTVVSREGAC